MFTQFVHRYTNAMVGVAGAQARVAPPRALPPIVLTDVVTPEIRLRKPDPEFPLGIDVIGRRLTDEGFNVDYSFLPTELMGRSMRQGREPLRTLGMDGQPGGPVKDAAILGITMMNYLQSPQFFTLLALAGIPLERGDRGEGCPLVVVGGPVWQNPLPLSDYFDVLVAGDGEEVLGRIARLAENKRKNRRELLAAVAEIKGAFVPEFPRVPFEPAEIDFSDEKYCAGSSIVMNGTGAVILSRGCPHDCAFCANKASGGAYRTKPYSQIVRHIDTLSKAGAKRIVLCAASGSRYRSEGKGYEDVIREIDGRGMIARCMSDRPESLAPAALEMTKRDKNKMALAIESHPRIRAFVLQKSITESVIERAADACVRAGIGRIQLYTMLSIPRVRPGLIDHLPGGFDGESEADLAYLSGLGTRFADKMRQRGNDRCAQGPCVDFDCMPLIPAPGTRLQSLAFPKWEAYLESLERLRATIPPGYRDAVRVTAGLDRISHLLQALLDRGSNGTGRIVLAACRKSDFGILSVEDLRSAMSAHGIDEGALYNEMPTDTLPYAGMTAEGSPWPAT